jgi:hypothetical protein
VARKILGPKSDEVPGKWRRIHSKELLKLLNIFRMLRSMRMKWAGVVARMGKRRSAYRVMVRKPQAMTTFWKPVRRWGYY